MSPEDKEIFASDAIGECAQGGREPLRRTVDLLASIAFVILFFWLFVAVWVGVRLTTGSPAIYRHMRVGRSGEQFHCLKFRSMVPDAASRLQELLRKSPAAREEWEANFKLRNDPRVTKFGAFIRSTSLDELPQIFNVLKGEMSLVGPRPVTREELGRYYDERALRLYTSVKPGITGLWQVSGRSDLSYERRVELDSSYVERRTWRLDGWILARTVLVVLRRRGSC